MKKSMLILVMFSLVGMVLGMQGGCSKDEDLTGPGDQACSVSATTPRTGDQYATEGPFSEADIIGIRWDGSNAFSSVSINLLKNDILLGEVSPSTSNDGYHPWYATTMGQVSADDYALTITALSADGCADTTDNFRILNVAGCNFVLTFPAPETDTLQVNAGEVMTITWESEFTGNDTNIELMKQDQVVGLIASSVPDDGFYEWTVDSFHQGTYGFYWIRVSDDYVENCEGASGTFTMVDEDLCTVVVSAPQDVDVWNIGETRTIRFFTENSGANVDIRLLAGATYLGTIASDVPAVDEEFDWVVEDFDFEGNHDAFHILVVDSDDEYCQGQSEDFTIGTP